MALAIKVSIDMHLLSVEDVGPNLNTGPVKVAS